MTRKICVITGSRAEYGLLRWVMQGIKDEPSLTLQIIATGMHLSPEFGLTYKEIEKDFNEDTDIGTQKEVDINNIKNELKNAEDSKNLKHVVKIIDKNLNNTDDWNLFEEAFNNYYTSGEIQDGDFVNGNFVNGKDKLGDNTITSLLNY